MSLGARLRHAREEQGLTLDEIAKRTFIRVHHLDAIERDDYQILPPSRLRYFVRDYARALDLDPDLFLSDVPDEPDLPPAPPSRVNAERKEGLSPVSRLKKSAASRTPKLKKTAPPPVAAVPPAVEHRAPAEPLETVSPFDEEEEIRPTATTAQTGPRRKRPRYRPLEQGNPVLARTLITAAVLLLVILGAYYLFGGFDDSPGSGAEGDDTTSADSPTRIISRPGDLPDDDTTAAAGDSLVLEGRVVERVWYSIEMDGEREDAGTLDSGTVRQWKAVESFSVSLGNAGGIEFTLNGKKIGTLGNRGETIREKLITAEGAPQSGAITTPTTPTSSAQSTTPTRSSSASSTRRRATTSTARRSTRRTQSASAPRRPKLEETPVGTVTPPSE